MKYEILLPSAKIPRLDSSMTSMSPVFTLTRYNIHFNTILPSSPMSPNPFFVLILRIRACMYFFFSFSMPNTCRAYLILLDMMDKRTN
jgi:hypothetical protein